MQANQSFGPQYQDNVKNSRQFNQRRNSKQAYQHYKSPSRTSYQQRYPASFKMQQDNNPIRVNISPPKQNIGNNSQVRNKSPGVSQISASMGTYSQYPSKGYTQYGQKQFKQYNDDKGYNKQFNDRQYRSANRGSFIPSPYGNNNNYQHNNINTPNYNMGNIINSYQESNIKSRSLIQLQKVVSQLKISLQQSLSSQQSLQQQLNKQRGRSFQMSQMKRKLQQELSRMEFQLQRITNGDLLGQRQLMIKYQNEVKQNQRLNSQLNEVRQQLRKLRKQHRQVVTQSNQLKQQNQLLQSDNIQLINKLQQLTHTFNQISQQYNLSVVKQNQLYQQNQRLKQYQNNRESINRVSNDNNNGFAYNNIKSDQSIIRSQQSINNHINSIPSNNNNNLIPSIANINSINTTRSNNYDSNIHGKNHNNISNPQNQINYNKNKSKPQSPIYNSSPHKIHLQQQQQQINYDYQNSKLLQDYNKLMTQNQSMKKLYQQFYQPSQNNLSPNSLAQYQINQEDQQLQETKQQFYNHNNNNNNNNYDNQSNYEDQQQYQQQYHYQQSSQSPQQSQRLKTFQKTHLYQQVTQFRQQIIQSLIQNYYSLALSQAQQQKANVLVIFIKTINKNLPTIQKMVINYLQARDIMKKQLQNNRLKDIDENSPPQTKYQQQAQQLWINTKQKLKTQLKAHSLPNNNTLNKNQIITLNINAYYLALFRLLTLIHKYENNTIHPDSNTLTKIKHQALKYIHKIYQQTTKIKNTNK